MTTTTQITLSAPLHVEGRTINTVTLRRPKAGDLRRMEKAGGADLDKTLFLIGALAEMTPAEVDELDAKDLERIGQVVAGFTGTAG